MLGRILAEARVAAVGAGRDAQARGDRRRAPALPDPAHPPAELGLGPDRLLAELEFDYDGALRPGGPDHPAGRLRPSCAWSSAATRRPRRRPTSCSSSWASARRRTPASSRGRWSSRRSGWRRSTRDLVAGRLAGRGRGEAVPPGRRVQARRDDRDRLVRARRRRRLRRPERAASPTSSPPPAGARPWSPWATARSACSPRTGSRSTGCSPTWAPPRTATSGSATTQAGLLDALLAAQPEIRVRRGVRRKVREQLRQFEGVEPLDAPAGLPGRAPPLPARGPRLARLPPEVRLRRLPGRRHGPGQDRPGARPARAPPARGGRPRARRWSSCPARWSSTGCRRPRGSRPSLRVLDHTGPGRARAPRGRSTTTT